MNVVYPARVRKITFHESFLLSFCTKGCSFDGLFVADGLPADSVPVGMSVDARGRVVLYATHPSFDLAQTVSSVPEGKVILSRAYQYAASEAEASEASHAAADKERAARGDPLDALWNA